MSINWAHLGRFAFYSKRRALLEKDQLELFEGREHCLVVLYLQMEDVAMASLAASFSAQGLSLHIAVFTWHVLML